MVAPPSSAMRRPAAAAALLALAASAAAFAPSAGGRGRSRPRPLRVARESKSKSKSESESESNSSPLPPSPPLPSPPLPSPKGGRTQPRPKRSRRPSPPSVTATATATATPQLRRRVRDTYERARDLERSGRWGEASAALREALHLDPRDAHSHLALARLESRREGGMEVADGHVAGGDGGGGDRDGGKGKGKGGRRRRGEGIRAAGDRPGTDGQPPSRAREAFRAGTELCPNSVHLWQAWAVYEQSRGREARARELFETALGLDPHNPYVCHAYGLLEQREGNPSRARELWEGALEARGGGNGATAALVCSLGDLHAGAGRLHEARDLYEAHALRLRSPREVTEVHLAAAWLEEKRFGDRDRAAEILHRALEHRPGDSRARVALARLEGRRAGGEGRAAGGEMGGGAEAAATTMRDQLARDCAALLEGDGEAGDGRLFNAWAKLEVRAGKLEEARDILRRGMDRFPGDQSLLQAAGKVEERLGNHAAARESYRQSLAVEPSAPALVAYALLEHRHPEREGEPADLERVRGLFEEALLLDRRHGPAYNAYGNMELQHSNVDEARIIFKRGVVARCSDAASVYHGLGKLELSRGNVDRAREVLMAGLIIVEKQQATMQSSQRGRAKFLAHTLGMLELNSNRFKEASKVFRSGLKHHPNSSQLLLGAALSEMKLGNEDKARKLFERAAMADPKHAQAWQAWAVMEMRGGHYKVAQTLLDCGIKEVPGHGALWQAYGTMESRRGNFGVARTLFAAGIEKCPNHVPLYQGWACLELRGGNYEQAKVLISEALTRDKQQGSGWLVAAKIEEKAGNTGLASMFLERGLETAPNDASLHCALGELLIADAKFDKARDVFEQGLAVDPLHAPLYHSLAELEARLFNLDGLARLNKRAAEVFHANALDSPPASSQAWGNKIKMASESGATKLPDGVAALAAKVGLDEDLEEMLSDVNPASLIISIAGGEDDTEEYTVEPLAGARVPTL